MPRLPVVMMAVARAYGDVKVDAGIITVTQKDGSVWSFTEIKREK